jgi:hypothetical protein
MTGPKDVASSADLANWELLLVHKFQAQIKHSPPVTMLHTLTCPMCGVGGDELRIVRARNVAEAVLDLVATYMTANVRRNVSVCGCTKVDKSMDGH